MDKSFNDQELSDIMKEIEALEDDFKGEDPTEPTPQMQALAELDEKAAIPKKQKSEVLPFAKPPAPKSEPSQGSSMSFKVQGDMRIELFFEVGGKSVSLEVNDEGLSVQMEGGVTFNVPIQDKKAV